VNVYYIAWFVCYRLGLQHFIWQHRMDTMRVLECFCMLLVTLTSKIM